MMMTTDKRYFENIWEMDHHVIPLIYKYDQHIDTVPYKLKIQELVANHIKARDMVLDVGCGCGHFSTCIVNAGAIYEGVDKSKLMLKNAKLRFPTRNFRHGDAYELPYGNSSFDITFSNDLIAHVPDPTQILKEMYRVCRRKMLVVVGVQDIGKQKETNRNGYITQCYNTKDIKNHILKLGGSFTIQELNKLTKEQCAYPYQYDRQPYMILIEIEKR